MMQEKKGELSTMTIALSLLVCALLLGVVINLVTGGDLAIADNSSSTPVIASAVTADYVTSISEGFSVYFDKPPADAGSQVDKAVRDAVVFFEREADITVTEVTSVDEADMVIQYVKDFGTSELGHAINQRWVSVGFGDSKCREWLPYDYDTVYRIVLHEMGHALGAKHTNDESSVMYPNLSVAYEQDLNVSAYLPADLAQFYPLCATKSTNYSFTIDSQNNVNVIVLVNASQAELFKSGEEYVYREECRVSGVESTTFSCVVNPGNVLAISQTPRINPFKGSVGYDLVAAKSK